LFYLEYRILLAEYQLDSLAECHCDGEIESNKGKMTYLEYEELVRNYFEGLIEKKLLRRRRIREEREQKRSEKVSIKETSTSKTQCEQIKSEEVLKVETSTCETPITSELLPLSVPAGMNESVEIDEIEINEIKPHVNASNYSETVIPVISIDAIDSDEIIPEIEINEIKPHLNCSETVIPVIPVDIIESELLSDNCVSEIEIHDFSSSIEMVIDSDKCVNIPTPKLHKSLFTSASHVKIGTSCAKVCIETACIKTFIPSLIANISEIKVFSCSCVNNSVVSRGRFTKSVQFWYGPYRIERHADDYVVSRGRFAKSARLWHGPYGILVVFKPCLCEFRMGNARGLACSSLSFLSTCAFLKRME